MGKPNMLCSCSLFHPHGHGQNSHPTYVTVKSKKYMRNTPEYYNNQDYYFYCVEKAQRFVSWQKESSPACLPPNTFHALQPPNIAVFSPLKVA